MATLCIKLIQGKKLNQHYNIVQMYAIDFGYHFFAMLKETHCSV